jgi:hypothetical protein
VPRANAAGAVDGYCLMIMQIADHPWFHPGWTEVFGRSCKVEERVSTGHFDKLNASSTGNA